MFCNECGREIKDKAVICVSCGVETNVKTLQQKGLSRIVYILLAWFLGLLGVHNFAAGYTGRGVAQLLFTIFTGWLIFPLIVLYIWIVVEMATVTKSANGTPFS